MNMACVMIVGTCTPGPSTRSKFLLTVRLLRQGPRDRLQADSDLRKFRVVPNDSTGEERSSAFAIKTSSYLPEAPIRIGISCDLAKLPFMRGYTRQTTNNFAADYKPEYVDTVALNGFTGIRNLTPQLLIFPMRMVCLLMDFPNAHSRQRYTQSPHQRRRPLHHHISDQRKTLCIEALHHKHLQRFFES